MAAANDLTIYERHADEWWDPRAPAFRSLHTVHEYRLGLLREWLGERLDGRLVLDVGCGGGLLSDALARAGARVVGIDRSPGSLRTAIRRVSARFVQADATRLPLGDGRFDVVLLCDVVEHVPDPRAAMAEAARLCKPGGQCFVSTLNRTRRAEWIAVRLAEGVGLVPRGTHDARMFLVPDELHGLAADAGLELVRVQGESVDAWRTLRRWAITLRRSDDLSIGYSALYRRPWPA